MNWRAGVMARLGLFMSGSPGPSCHEHGGSMVWRGNVAQRPTRSRVDSSSLEERLYEDGRERLGNTTDKWATLLRMPLRGPNNLGADRYRRLTATTGE